MNLNLHEIVLNLHMHTTYSDGHVNHADIAQAALSAGIDAVIVSDHNVRVVGPEDYYVDGKRRVLLLIGEEIHDQARQPQKNHLLVLGANRELATLASDLPGLLTAVRQAGGQAYIAHPVDPGAPAVDEDDISWVEWPVQGITGLEVWNGMSEFKSLLKSKLHAVYYAYRPDHIANGPFPRALQHWDDMLAAGQRVAGIGGSDAHGLPASMGPLHKVIFPYEWHFRTINNHLLLEKPLSGNLETDRPAVLNALAGGRSFIGYDLPASTRGFRFIAHGFDRSVTMGDEISAQRGVTLQARLPQPAECRLVCNGKVVQTWSRRETCAYITSQPGAYRVEVYIEYRGRLRGWIFSNPIYVKK
jgi:hypothetical protein